jgi:hypothetical protein
MGRRLPQQVVLYKRDGGVKLVVVILLLGKAVAFLILWERNGSQQENNRNAQERSLGK